MLAGELPFRSMNAANVEIVAKHRVHLRVLLLEHDSEMFVEEHRNLQHIDRIEPQTRFAKDRGLRRDGVRGAAI